MENGHKKIQRQSKKVQITIPDGLACKNCQYFVESKTSQQFGHCLRNSIEPSVHNTVETDWFCKGFFDESRT